MDYARTLPRPQGRILSTLEEDGSRRWLEPRLARGRFWWARRAVAYALIALFTLLPYAKVNGKPAVLLDVLRRQFTILGYTFLPTDTVLLALLMVGLILGVFFFTALFGRAWCGWACPQTVYMEFVYRPIERLFSGRAGVGGRPRGPVPAWRRALMYGAFLLVSLYLAHTFLAYFVGVEALRTWVTRSPWEHPAAFAVIAVTTGLMMFDFAYFREQTCLIACPYGRLQSVLMDRWSLIISYDGRRGEPRGKRIASYQLPVASPDAATAPKGDCVDCGLCAAVCPTGIDIRDGLQFECIGCAQCIDACDAVMEKLKRPRGLIRYSSQTAMAGEEHRIVRPRVVIYSVIIAALGSLLTFLIVTKSPTDVTLLRNVGRPFALGQDGSVENWMRVKLTNRTEHPQRLRLTVASPAGVSVTGHDEVLELPAGQTRTEPVRFLAPLEAFRGGELDVRLRVSGDDGTVIERECRLLGPVTGP